MFQCAASAAHFLIYGKSEKLRRRKMTKKGKTILVSTISGVLLLGGIGTLTDKDSNKTNLPNNSNTSISTTTDSVFNSSKNNIISSTESEIQSLDVPEPAPSESEAETSTSTETKPPSTVSAATPTKPTETSSSTVSVTPPKEITYVLNTSTHKVHKLHCRDVGKIAPENYATTTNSQGAKSNGYTACGHCKPF